MRSSTSKVTAKWVVLIVVMVAILLIPGPVGLRPQALATIATLWFTIFAMSANLLPESIAALVGFCLFYHLKAGTVAQITSGVVGAMFLTGTIFGPIVPGLVSAYPECLGEFTWLGWLKNAWLYGIVAAVGLFFALWFVYKPSPDDIDSALQAEWSMTK